MPSRANPVPAAAPWKDGARALAKSGGKAVAAAGLALSFWPAASFAAEDLEIDEGLAATQAFLSSISKSGNVKKGSGKAAVPVGDSSLPDFGRAAPKETAPEIAAADSLAHEEGLADGRHPRVRFRKNRQRGARRRDQRATTTEEARDAGLGHVQGARAGAEGSAEALRARGADLHDHAEEGRRASLKATGEFFASISKKVR